MTPLVAKLIWLARGRQLVRHPLSASSAARDARPKRRRSDHGREIVLMAISATGLGIVPAIYVLTGVPHFANYSFRPGKVGSGRAIRARRCCCFHRTHKELGRNWSVTLEVREHHTLGDERHL